MELYIDDNQSKVNIGEDIEKELFRVVKKVLEIENIAKEYEISISFVDNETIKKLNRDYRGVDMDTDVLSFPLEDNIDVGGPTLLGDIIISLEKALEQSKDFGHTLEREIAYLTVHSMLHLLGYDHMEEEEKFIMRSKEKEIMKQLGIFKKEKEES
ncbi:MAG: rRNA maturation RNase YbeY [Tissierellaceae bacterium]|nr:rRNA maturation RNase YbeY [Tissierellaceae bacterium]